MAKRRRFTIRFAPEVVKHLDVIEIKYHRLIRRAIDEQLSLFPGHVTRNRRPLEAPAPFGAAWELRFGPGNRSRVFYGTEPENLVVNVLAVGIKNRNRLRIGREEFVP